MLAVDGGKEKRYIFLDVDGVLNARRDWHRPCSFSPACLRRFGLFLDRLASSYKVECILSTSWRIGFSRDEQKCTPQILELVRFLSRHGVRVVGRTPEINQRDRSREVMAYISQHSLPYGECIVIDDDASIFPEKLPQDILFILCNPDVGFPADCGDGRKGIWDGFIKAKERISAFLRY